MNSPDGGKVRVGLTGAATVSGDRTGARGLASRPGRDAALTAEEVTHAADGCWWRTSARLKQRTVSGDGSLKLRDIGIGPLASLVAVALSSEIPGDMYIDCPRLGDGFGLAEMKWLATQPDFPSAATCGDWHP
jgi:hypothetical protein